MEKTEIILVIALSAFAALKIYQKYFRKDQNTTEEKKRTGHDSFSSAGDDYEPYSGKQNFGQS